MGLITDKIPLGIRFQGVPYTREWYIFLLHIVPAFKRPANKSGGVLGVWIASPPARRSGDWLFYATVLCLLRLRLVTRLLKLMAVNAKVGDFMLMCLSNAMLFCEQMSNRKVFGLSRRNPHW